MILEEEHALPVIHLYDKGLYLQALNAGLPFGQLKDWGGPRGRMIAGRLAGNLGAPRLSRLHRLLAWRETPDDPEVLYYRAFTRLETHGPYVAWKFLNEHSFPTDANPDLRSSWFTLYGQTLTLLHDFSAAEEWMKQAEDVAPDNPWVHVGWSTLYEDQDRYEEALAAVDRSLSLRSWYRPGVQAKGHLLPLLGRDDEAEAFLKEASSRLESSAVYLSWAGILLERESYDELGIVLQKVDELSPLMETQFAKGMAGLRSLIAYRLGDIDGAIRYAKQSGDKFELKMADRLEDPARRQRRRVKLPVGFVRQHEKTCVPATLSAISRYWSMPAEHLQIAESICYDGTSSYNERNWANTNGWYTREFTVSEESTERLIDAGIPFTLTTTAPGGGHLQAVIGYDGLRGTLIVRDPYMRNWSEGFADGIIEHYQAFGPRGMAMVPVAERGRLEVLDLPDAALWDQLHLLDGALESHRRSDAEAVYIKLQEDAPQHRITFEAERRLMLYDANPTGMLAAIDKLLSLYPNDPLLQLSRLSRLRDLAKREERVETLQRLCEEKDAHPMFLSQLAQELSADAREHERAVNLLNRAMRRNPLDAGNFYILAGIRSDQRQFDESLDLYRFTACLDDKNESAAEAYFRMAQFRQQTDAALDWIRRRVDRFGKFSSQPVRTYELALRRLSRDEEGVAALEKAIELRPDDGELLLYAADIEAYATFRHIDRARELYRRAEGRVSRTEWLRVGARLASYESNYVEALRIWREVVALQPMAVDAHRAIASLLSELEGQAAAINHVKSVAERFPHHQPLLVLSIEYLREEPAEVMEAAIRRLIELNPADAWGHRELGFLMTKLRRFDEAAECAEAAGRLDPTHTSWFHLRGEIAASQSRFADARTEYREALRLSIDNDFAMDQLLTCCETTDERIQELSFLLDELTRQVIYGDGLLNYRGYASQLIDPEELLKQLREALKARPDLWHAWSACVRQLTDMDRLDEALELSNQATERFPLLPRIWLDRAHVCQVQLDVDGELAALEKCHEISPTWTEATRQLSDVYLRKGDFEKSIELLQRAIALSPQEGLNIGWLADVEWRQGKHDEALSHIEKAVQLSPGYSWAWDCLRYWSNELDDSDRPIRVAQELTERRPGEARSWLILARMLAGKEDCLEERLTTLKKAIELQPRCVAAFEQMARGLQLAGRTDEALEACSPPVFGEHRPVDLVACAAWIQWERGNREQAIKEMRAAVERDPSYYAGWSQLSDWLEAQKDYPGCLEASKMMVRLNPHVESSLGHLALAYLNNDDRKGAKEAFRRAFEMFPGYQFAGLWLFDLEEQDNQLEEAAKVLAVLDAHTDGPFVTSKRAILATRTKDRELASSSFRELCLDTDNNSWPLSSAYDAMKKAKWLEDVRRVASEAFEEEKVHSEVGKKWIQAHVDDRRWDLKGRLKFLVERHPRAGGFAVYEWVEALLNAGRKSQFHKFARVEDSWLRTNSFAWGSVGWGMTRIKDYKSAYQWLKDWREQKAAEPWMLVNAVEAFRDRGKNVEANEISRHALTLSPDGGVPLHQLWLAADEVVAGDFAAARERMTQVDRTTLDADYTFLMIIIEVIVEMMETPADQRRATFTSVRKRVNLALYNYTYQSLSAERSRRLFYRYGVKQIAKAVGGWRATLWMWYRVAFSY